MADRIFISELAQAESVNDDLMFVSDDGTQTSKVNASQIKDYVMAGINPDDFGSVKSVNDIEPDENGNITLTAEDIGITPGTGGGGSENIQSFSSYTQLGLTIDDFVEDDFMANAIKIFEAMPDYSVLTVKTYNSALSKSIVAKINADNNGTLSSTVGSTLYVEKTTQDFSGNFRVVLNSRSLSYAYFCMLHYNSTDGYLITKLSTTYRPEGFVKKSGDTMAGNLSMQKSAPEILLKNTGSGGRYADIFMGSTDGIFYIRNAVDSSNRVGIYIQPETASDFNKVFRLQKTVGGTTTYYSIFGGHNKPTGTYNGNGSSSERTIDLNGIGDVVVITNDSSNYLCYVTPVGGFSIDSAGEITPIKLSAAHVEGEDGANKLIIKSTSAYLNSSSKTYKWRLL